MTLRSQASWFAWVCVLAVAGLALSASAASITFAWDPSPDDAAIDGYRLYRSFDGVTWAEWSNYPRGTTNAVAQVAEGSHTYWTVTCYASAGNVIWPDGAESDRSNMVDYTAPGQIPTTPTLNLR